ncbi:hypothetical protein [Lysinibacillus sphaericus]
MEIDNNPAENAIAPI